MKRRDWGGGGGWACCFELGVLFRAARVAGAGREEADDNAAESRQLNLEACAGQSRSRSLRYLRFCITNVI